jgi:aldehyde dehydrogenase (NAD+)
LNDWFSGNVEESSCYCRIVSTRHAERLNGMLHSTNGDIVLGGKIDVDNRFLEPTVITGVTLEDSTMQEEIFGPILPIINIKNIDEAIDLINSRDKPLAMYVFSENQKSIKKLRDNTSSGGFTVNETILQLSVEELPFGGVGSSGMGAYHGKHGFDTFTHYKPVLEKNLGWLGEKLAEFRYPPYNPKNINFIKALIKNREMPSFAFLNYLLSLAVGTGLGILYTKYANI